MKLKKKSGFTLIEMLIVVAIIAVLVMVSIPLVSNSLEKARAATDAANERAFKAELIICYLNETDGTATGTFAVNEVYGYDVVTGKITTSAASLKGYGQCKDHKDFALFGYVDDQGEVHYGWYGAFSGGRPSTSQIGASVNHITNTTT